MHSNALGPPANIDASVPSGREVNAVESHVIVTAMAGTFLAHARLFPLQRTLSVRILTDNISGLGSVSVQQLCRSLPLYCNREPTRVYFLCRERCL